MVRILVIDDEAQVRDVLRQMLEKAGYEVVEAPEGAEGLQLHRKHPVDLIITDIVMPGKEGIETILALRKCVPKVKIIAISGGGHMNKLDLLSVAQEFGAARTLAKPFARKELLAAVQEVLG
ncbi:MAG: response regulator [Deltaproteobacteria bacterium]|nr:response regulator [Deltaproteobacteria bacterium]